MTDWVSHPGPSNSELGILFFFFLRFHLFIFRERGREGEREGEKHQCVVAFHTPPTGDLARNPGMCPDWESNRQPFGSQASTQSTELHHLGQNWEFLTTRMCPGKNGSQLRTPISRCWAIGLFLSPLIMCSAQWTSLQPPLPDLLPPG